MSSPFPGMDPYLEDDALWPRFHHQFAQTLHQIIQPSLINRYRAQQATALYQRRKSIELRRGQRASRRVHRDIPTFRR
jgi:hypothetical protein